MHVQIHLKSIETDRLLIRPLRMEDLDALHAINNAGFGEIPLDERRAWLEWATRNTPALENLYQPPLGDRAVVLKASGELVAQVGFVACHGPFERLTWFAERLKQPDANTTSMEMGLFWATHPDHQRQGYAREAAAALIDYAFTGLRLNRIIATTEYDNEASIAVMRSLGMVINRNPQEDPSWFQVVGILANPQP